MGLGTNLLCSLLCFFVNNQTIPRFREVVDVFGRFDSIEQPLALCVCHLRPIHASLRIDPTAWRFGNKKRVCAVEAIMCAAALVADDRNVLGT